MSGSSGCNSYTSPYAASDGLMTIGPVVSTRMACAQPDGVMAQESAYLNALDEAAYYEIHGDTLDLLDSESKLLLSYTGQQS
jgi:heat shock protein HslJ